MRDTGFNINIEDIEKYLVEMKSELAKNSPTHDHENSETYASELKLGSKSFNDAFGDFFYDAIMRWVFYGKYFSQIARHEPRGCT